VGTGGRLSCEVLVQLAEAHVPAGGVARCRVASVEHVDQRETAAAVAERLELEAQFVTAPGDGQGARRLARQDPTGNQRARPSGVVTAAQTRSIGWA
jgi:hypothetical protein